MGEAKQKKLDFEKRQSAIQEEIKSIEDGLAKEAVLGLESDYPEFLNEYEMKQILPTIKKFEGAVKLHMRELQTILKSFIKDSEENYEQK